MPKRDNDYYLKQLRTKHPLVYADLQAGKFSSPGDAFRAAGIKKPRTRLQELKNAWLKAVPMEQKEFDKWRGSMSGAAPAPSAVTSHLPAIASHRRLEPWAITRIQHLISVHKLTMGELMDEIGFPRLNGSLGSALRRGSRLDPAMLRALEKWLQANSAV